MIACAACGGASAETPARHAEPIADAGASSQATSNETPTASVVHFDDLGMTFVVPPGFHVIGDAELASRIGSSASAHLQADLRKRADAKKGVPLLALSKDELNFTLSVVVVPTDATAMELAQHQQEVMAANLQGFELVAPLKDREQNGVMGAEMTTRYQIDQKRVQSRMRLFVRTIDGAGVATLVTVVWMESASKSDEATALLDGLAFQH